MSTARFRTALACTCISLAAGAAAAGAPPPLPAAVELEVGLARVRDLYLVVDAGRAVIEVKARGVVLEQVPLRRTAILAPGPLLGGGDPPPLELPAVWRVTEPPGELERRVVAPETLKPYSEEEAQSEPEAATPTPTPSSSPRHPLYRLAVDAGWRLEIGPGTARTGFVERIGGGLRHLWQRLTGSDQLRAPVLALEIEPEDADRLHHLFRTGLAILVVPPTTRAPAGGEPPPSTPGP